MGAPAAKVDLLGLLPDELARFLSALGEPPPHVPLPPRGPPYHRDRPHPSRPPHHRMRLQPDRLCLPMPLLRHRTAGPHPRPHGRRDRPAGCPRPRALPRPAGEGLQLALAISLHAATDEVRDQLVPVNRAHPIAELIAAAREYAAKTGRKIAFQ